MDQHSEHFTSLVAPLHYSLCFTWLTVFLWIYPCPSYILLLRTFCGQFTAVHFQYNSMGALGCLAIGFVAARRWSDAGMGWLSKAANTQWSHDVEHDIANLWANIAQPLLFSVIGASIDFSAIDTAIIPRALSVILVGTLVRVPVAIGVTWGNNLSWLERTFVGLSWIPKATVQVCVSTTMSSIIY